MFRIPICLALSIVSIGASLRAEIFADFALSRDGEPLGSFRVKLFHEKAPRPVANFVGLATGDLPWLDPRTSRVRNATPFYDGTIFHRLIHDFMIQGGDPLGTGSGGPGYVFQDQFHPDLRHDGRYMLSMAHAGPHTNGSQFFITLEDASHLDDYHSVFGEVIDGREVIDAFTDTETFPANQQNRPLEPIVLESVTLSGSALADFRADLHQHGLPRIGGVNPTITSKETAESGNGRRLHLAWPREAFTDYLLLGSRDLDEWQTLGFGMSVDAEEDFGTDVSNIFSDSPTVFFRLFGVDYNHLPVIPVAVLASGTRIELSVMDGLLTIEIGSGVSGTWTFVDSEGTSTNGTVVNFWEDQNDSERFLESSGFYVDQRTLARLLPVRRVTFIFGEGEEAGSLRLTAIQPVLSFHEATNGWFNGLVNSNSPGNLPPFRGSFAIEFAPED
ncbi:MAG: peptidylprolyl isomerase [Opitutales bacterium]|nr:peptidylprolyl isomerase [Opitutales bacterium]